MNSAKLKILTERYEKENQNIKLHEEFIVVPSGLNPVSGKFYSKYDAFTDKEARQDYFEFVKKYARSTPKDNFDFPPPSANME